MKKTNAIVLVRATKEKRSVDAAYLRNILYAEVIGSDDQGNVLVVDNHTISNSLRFRFPIFLATSSASLSCTPPLKFGITSHLGNF